MKFLKWLVGIFALLWILVGAAFLIAGLMISAERSFTNEVEINAPAEKVWEAITDKSRYTEWQTAITKVEMVDEKNWVEYLKDSPEPMHFTVVNDKRPAEMEFHYKMGDAFNGHWHGKITPTANGVKLQTTDSYKADGWLTKIMIGAFFDMDSFAKDWNTKLKARAESIK